jgi:hypothetical protein
MGTVYAAVNLQDEQAAAVKVLAAALSHDEGFRERFEAEVESLRKLRHPHIVRLYGFGEQDGLMFYGMELVDGRSLEEEIAGGRRFDWSEVTRIAIQTCRALKHAHDRGIIHRDIKPANLMLTPTREVKLSDFGIAKLFGATGMTAEGGIIGTAEFMAPEQADGRAATDRTDLYSLGGVMYALLAGRPPFRAKTLPEMLQLQRFAEPDPVRRFAPDTPVELEKIIAQLLAKEPEKRLANAGVLARRLEAMIDDIADSQPDTKPVMRTDVEIANAATLAAPENGGPMKSPSDTMEFMPAALPIPDKSAPTGGRLASTIAADGALQAQADPTFELAPTIARQTTRIFKTVEEADQEDAEREPSDGHALGLQTLGLAAAILLVGLFIWYMLQPPDAATLYARVEASVKEDQDNDGVEEEDEIDIQGLSAVRNEIKTLLQDHNAELDITQRARLERYEEELELDRLERQLDRESRRVSGKQLTPIERAYLDAIVTLRSNRAAGLEKLKALVNLFGIVPDNHISTGKCLKLARRQIRRVEDAMAESADDDLRYIDGRLTLASTYTVEEPDESRRIYEGLLVIYGEQPWAQEVLQRVQALLDALPPKGTVGPDIEVDVEEPAPTNAIPPESAP